MSRSTVRRHGPAASRSIHFERGVGFAALAFAAILCGCIPEQRVLARVGSRTVTVEEFRNLAQMAAGRYPGSPEEAKRLLLEDLIRRELLLERAENHGSFDTSLVRDFRRNATDEIALETLRDRLVPANIPVSQAEVEKLHEWRRTEARMQVVFNFDRALIEGARRELDQGSPFESVADRFNVPGMVPPGGNLGFLVPGTLVSPLDTYLREAPIGQIIGPVQATGEGWFVLRILERRPHDEPPLEEEAALLSDMLRQRKQRQALSRAYKELRALYHVRQDPGAGQFLFAQFNRAVILGDSVPPDADTRKRVLARYDGDAVDPGIYTFGDARDDISSGRAQPPPTTLVAAFEQWIESRIYQRIALIEARRRHIQEEPAVAKRIDERVNDYLLDSIYNEEVVRGTPEVTEEEVRALYSQRHAELAPGDQSATYESLPPDFQQTLRSRLLEMKREVRLQVYTDSLRRALPVTVNEGLLKRIPWPAAVVPGSG